MTTSQNTRMALKIKTNYIIFLYKSTHLDTIYFLRGKSELKNCFKTNVSLEIIKGDKFSKNILVSKILSVFATKKLENWWTVISSMSLEIQWNPNIFWEFVTFYPLIKYFTDKASKQSWWSIRAQCSSYYITKRHGSKAKMVLSLHIPLILLLFYPF